MAQEKRKAFQEYFSPEALRKTFIDKIKSKPSIGIDGTSASAFESTIRFETETCSKKIKSYKFQFSPYLEEVKSKGKNKLPRVISKPTIRDKTLLSSANKCLQSYFPEAINKKLPNEIIREIKETLKDSEEDLFFCKIDIKSFYDHINHDILLKNLSRTLDKKTLWLISKAIKNITVSANTKRKYYSKENSLGVPQGLPISNILSDIYLHKIDKKFKSDNYRRYVDDILIIAPTETSKITNQIKTLLEKIKLETNEKTEEGQISQGLEYLGYIFLGNNNVSVRDSSRDKFTASLIAPITRYKKGQDKSIGTTWLTIETRKNILIEHLNEKITGAISEKKRFGWIFYFIEITNLKILYDLDAIVKRELKKAHLTPSEISRVKSLSRAYHEAKHKPEGGYIHNYDIYKTTQEKITALRRFGYLDPNASTAYAPEHIDALFEKLKSNQLLQLERDIGTMY
ncbi:Retron-type reverse transcriptase [Pseudomonas sp. 22 E 5]|nr:Retron-type reverse transcriptase [Pseudomonas sp. 22 E 5]